MLKEMRRLHRYVLATALLGAAFALPSCSSKPPRFSTIAEEFVLNSLTFSPSAATAVGYRRHNGVPLDELLDEFAEPALNRQRNYYARFLQGLARDVTREKLSPEDQVDFDIVSQQIALGRLELDELRTWERDPRLYAEVLGNALFVPWVQEYAPEKARYYHILKRLEKFRSRVEQAKRNLKNVPPFWVQMGLAANAATVALIDKIAEKRPTEMATKFDAAAADAKAALTDFAAHLKTLSGPEDGWRLGPGLYKKQLQLVHGAPLEPAQLLAAAEAELSATQAELAALAGGAQKIKPMLDSIASQHGKREEYFPSAERILAEATAFVRAKSLLTLPDTSNLKVIETPAFLRGIYTVGGFNPSPALQPQLGAQYWLTPIPADWPPARIESKLREYNRYGLALLTIHEAMPGHYVQFEISNRLEPRGRKLLRTVFANQAFAEGWAIYSTEMMIKAGFAANDPNLYATFLKQQLRAVSNAILDIKFHTQNWPEAEALRYLIDQTYQEREEAEAKIQRAKLSSVQLTTYFAGYRAFRQLRTNFKGSDREFHDAVLKLGAIPTGAVAKLLAATPI
jgi:uncharacterized protein (DUF885 family)